MKMSRSSRRPRKSRPRERPSKPQRPRRLPIKPKLKAVKRMLKKLLPRLRQMPLLLLAPWPSRRRKLRRRSRKESRKRRKRVRRRMKRQRRPRPTRRPLWLARLPRMLNKRTLISQRSKPMLTRPMQRKKRLPRRLTIK